MDITRILYDTENNLKSYINIVFTNLHGNDWMSKIKIPKSKLKSWELARIPNELSHNAIKGKEDLLQYTSIPDLRWLLKKHWNAPLQQTFGDFENLDVYLRIIEDYRDPDSRRRELLTYQKHLILGVTGEIMTKISRARSLKEVGNPGYPRINSVKDSFGNLWTAGSPKRVKTNLTLRDGDLLEFVVSATDPEENDLQYRINNSKWQTNNVIQHMITSRMIGKGAIFNISIKNGKKFHAYPAGYDDRVSFEYDILPADY